MKWRYRVKVRDLLTKEETPAAVSKALNAIADRLEAEPAFGGFTYIDRMRNETDINLANALIGFMYDYADANRIWIE
jgi:hypothetical protein